jgi:16S rRNA (cytidine1402-2'-O)-methyltransferase
MNKKNRGELYLIPSPLGENSSYWIPQELINKIDKIKYFITESEKGLRRFIKNQTPKKSQENIIIKIINKSINKIEYKNYLNPCKNGFDIGLLSDAGCPCIADPGSEIVKIAHENKIKVNPIIGPSSIILAMMSSGLNGQNFAFNGYLPVKMNELEKKLYELEKKSLDNNQSQIFIETPYRNMRLFNTCINKLKTYTKLCVARDINMPSETILTTTIAKWKNKKINLHKKPSVFIIQSDLPV